MVDFTSTPCTPQGEPTEASSPFSLIQQVGGETYMGERRFVVHRDEIQALVAALQGSR